MPLMVSPVSVDVVVMQEPGVSVVVGARDAAAEVEAGLESVGLRHSSTDRQEILMLHQCACYACMDCVA